MYIQILVMGAGAVGGYFGGRLAQRSSADVLLIARGKHLQAMNERGLQVKSIDGDTTIQVEAREHLSQNYRPDLVLFTVKSYDTEQAIKKIKPAMGEQTHLLTIQNGIENYEKLVNAFGSQRVIQGFCKIGTGVPHPGIIEHKAFGKITAGEKNGESSRRLRNLKTLFNGAEIPFKISSKIDQKVWLKFAWNSIFNMITAVAGVTVEKLFEHVETEALCCHIFDEIKAVAKAEGVTLTRSDGESIVEPARELKGFETSTYQDRQKGKKMEYEAFTGAIVRLARKHEVAVPHNETLYALLKLIDKGD